MYIYIKDLFLKNQKMVNFQGFFVQFLLYCILFLYEQWLVVLTVFIKREERVAL